MTDRLTPGMLRDLADLCSVGNRVVTLTANGETTRFYPNKDLAYVLREEAARREAEAKPVATMVAPLDDPKTYVARTDPEALREGPGSAAAYYTDTFVCPPDTNADHWAWFLSERSPEYAAVRICEMIERSNESRRALREELAKALANAKPAPAAPAFWKGSTLDPECKSAPAADDLVQRLRCQPVFAEPAETQRRELVMLEAADRIEKAEARVRELEADRETGYARALGDRNTVVAALNAEKARADKLVRLARQMLGETYVVTGERPSSPVGRPTVVVDYDAALAMWDAISTEGGDRG